MRTHKRINLLLASSIFMTALASHAAPIHDPTLPLEQRGRGAVVAEVLNLHSILVSDLRKLAIINGKALREGERINEHTLVSIHGGFVTLNTKGRRWNLYLHERGEAHTAGIRK